MIYFDNAATTYIKPDCVIEAVIQSMQSTGNAGRGGHEISLESSRNIYNAREKLADFFCFEDVSGIVFTANSTESLNIALQGILEPQDHVITTILEHNSVLRPLYLLESKGMEVSFIPCDEKGIPEYNSIPELIRSNTKAIIVTHASNVTGNIIDINTIGAIARKHNLIFIVDASQTAGSVNINAEEMGIDVLCTTGHKGLMGPQGVGVLAVRKGINIEPLLVGGSGIQSFDKNHPANMPARLEAGTLNGHGIAGLYAALEFIEAKGIRVIADKEQELMWRFYKGIRNLKTVKVYGNFEVKDRSPIVSLNVGHIDSAETADILAQEYGIATRAGAHCAPLMHQFFGTERQGMVRFSFGYFNTFAEVDTAINAVRELAENS
ncbi:aminotransferase class V-fold PLP-dependent enzyme [Aminipila sp.]|uniref:aminotransferase class V-fold PLP-dependent enzyme n=1 Tax=Aminipila sp. TaxID=2060095 RepID=UPI0028A190EA|nr:aminotransferase class V-fold PLP-dependent enzyme [Aminipila sp.]